MTPERLAQIDIAIVMFRQTHPGSFGDMVSELRAYVDGLEAELAPQEPVTDVVQLVVPRGPMLEGLQKVLRALNCTMAGPLPLDREPIPTYVLQPLDIEESKT